MKNTQEMDLLGAYEEDSNWFYKNIDKLRKNKLTGKYVAIKNKKTIEKNKDLNLVLKSLEKKGENPSLLFIEFVYPKGTTILF